MRWELKGFLLVFLIGVLVMSGLMIYREQTGYEQGRDSYQEAEALAAIPPLQSAAPRQKAAPSNRTSTTGKVYQKPRDPNIDALQQLDIRRLRRQNEQIIGWLAIPGTTMSYPLVQGTDNEFYLKHDWKGDAAKVGAIFLDAQTSHLMDGFHSIVYGHNMQDGSMFAGLEAYSEADFYETHPGIYFSDGVTVRRYDIYAVYEADTDGDAFRIRFDTDDAKQAFLSYGLQRSCYDTGIVPDIYDRILTLATCTNRGYETRWVIQAVLAT